MNTKSKALLIGAGLLFIILIIGIFILTNPSMEWVENSLNRSQDMAAVQGTDKVENQPEKERIRLSASSLTTDEVKEQGLPVSAANTVRAWRIHGKAKTWDKKTVPGAEIILRIRENREYHHPEIKARTDENGCYEAILPLPEAIRLMPPGAEVPHTIVGWANARGYRSGRNRIDDLAQPGPESAPLQLDLFLHPDATIHGFVTTVEGRPVENCDIYLQGSDNYWFHLDSTDPDGYYTATTEETGSFHLIAMKDNFSRSSSEKVYLAPPQDTEAPLLVILAFESIEGWVVDPQGKPVDRFGVQALPAEMVEASNDTLKDFEEVHCPEQEEYLVQNPELDECRGLSYGYDRPDSAGRFRIGGLAPGQHFLRLPYFEDQYLEDPEEAPRVVCATGDRNARIVVPYYRMRVFLKEPERKDLLSEAWLTHIHKGFRHHGTRVKGGVVDLDARPGTFTLEARAAEGLFVKREIHLERGDYESEFELVLQKDEPALLHLFLTDRSGYALRDVDDFILHAYGLTSGEVSWPLSDLERNKEGAILADVPADTHRVLVVPGGEQNFYLPAAKNVFKAGPGEEVRKSLAFTLGGRLDIRFVPELEQNRSPEDRVRIYRRVPRNRDEYLDLYAAFRPVEKLPFIHYNHESSLPVIANNILAQGKYRLFAKRKDFAVMQLDFVIEQGRTTELEIIFRPGRLQPGFERNSF